MNEISKIIIIIIIMSMVIYNGNKMVIMLGTPDVSVWSIFDLYILIKIYWKEKNACFIHLRWDVNLIHKSTNSYERKMHEGLFFRKLPDFTLRAAQWGLDDLDLDPPPETWFITKQEKVRVWCAMLVGRACIFFFFQYKKIKKYIYV